MLTLQITDESGKPELVNLDGPGRDLRIAVGSPQSGRSSVWRFAGSRTAGDVNLGNRDFMDFQKISLHDMGDFRLAWTTETLFDIAGHERHPIDRWRRASGNEAGWTLAFRIWIVSEGVDFIGIQSGKYKSIDSILWLPKPSTNHAMERAAFGI